ncbi:MAG: tetratricopeptide repeat protein [Phycisphaerae bacterium]
MSGVTNMLNAKIKSPASIDYVRELLNQGRPQDALKFIEHLGQKTPIMENARGVCLLRLGKIEQAISVLREVVFQGYICIPSDTPVLYQINFATAMLIANLKDAAIPILDRLDVTEYPQAAKLKDAISRWAKSLNLIERFSYHLGLYPSKPVKIDFPPGEV